MRLSTYTRHLIALAAFAAGAGWLGAQTAPAAKEMALKSALSSDLGKLMDQINTQRERMIADHDALAKQLKDATEEQRKAIMDKMQEQKKAFEAAQSALHKQIRDEQRRLRQGNAPGKR